MPSRPKAAQNTPSEGVADRGAFTEQLGMKEVPFINVPFFSFSLFSPEARGRVLLLRLGRHHFGEPDTDMFATLEVITDLGESPREAL